MYNMDFWPYQFTHKHLHVIYSEKALNELLPLAHKVYFKVHLYASYTLSHTHVIEAETINKVQILFSAPSKRCIHPYNTVYSCHHISTSFRTH